MGVSLPFVLALRNLRFSADLASFPTTGNELNLYVAQDTGGLYRWTGSAYSAIALNNVSFTVVGSYNATAGTPALTGLTASGQLYIVTTAGTQTINSVSTDLEVGDLIVRTGTADTYVVIPFQAALAGGVDDGRIPLVSSSTIVNSSLRETTTAIISDKTIEVPQGSLKVGEGVDLSEYGGLFTATSNVTDNRYLPVLYQETEGTIEPIAQNIPFYFTFDPEQDYIGDLHIIGTWNADTDVATVGGNDISGYQNAITEDNQALRVTTAGTTTVGAITSWAVGDFIAMVSGAFVKRQLDTETISDVSEISITSLGFNHRLHSITLDFDSDVTNFRARVTNLENNKVIKYFPSRAAYDNGTGGVDFSAGKQEVYPAGQSEATPVLLPQSTNFRIDIVADGNIDLKGDSNDVVYFAVNVCEMNTVFLADADDVTAVAIRDQLQTLTGDDRLDGSAIKGGLSDANAIHVNVAGEINGLTGKTTPANADIVVIEDSADSFNKKKITLGTIIGGMVTPVTPSVHNFSIDLPARVDIDDSSPSYVDRVNGSHVVTYSVTNYSHISSIALQLDGTDLVTLTTPTSDGEHTETITISGVDLTTQTNLVFRVQINGSTNSNTQTVEVANLTQGETAYYGVSTSDNDDTIDVSGLTMQEVESETSFIATFTLPTNNYAIILIPNTLDISNIVEQTFNQQSLADFTKTDDVRTISTVTYDSYVLQNQSQVTGDLIVNIIIG